MSKVVIVGGGLAGISAACELLERGCSVTILEKSHNLGGNSSKATTGIAAPGSELQKANGVTDSGADLVAAEPICKEMMQQGSKDVDWLLNLAGCKDEMVLRLTPGHGKVPRTLGTKDHFPGAVVTYAVMHQLEKIAKAKPDKLKIVTSATVSKLITEGNKVTLGSKHIISMIFPYGDFLKRGTPKSSLLIGFSIMNYPAIGVAPFMETPICTTFLYEHSIHGYHFDVKTRVFVCVFVAFGQVVGVEYQAGGAAKEMGLVLIATGGFAGDTSPASLMAKWAPQLLQMPTTSDERTSGDGISICSDVKAVTKNMNSVSLYPTSAMIPGMENDKFKIVLSDAIVGAGGKLINGDGNQFVNELETAQARADAMFKNKPPFRIVISEQDADAVKWLVTSMCLATS